MNKQNQLTKIISTSLNSFQNIVRNSSYAASSSYMLIFSILIGIIIGWYYDNKFSSYPLGTLIGLIIGLFVGFYQLAKLIWYKK